MIICTIILVANILNKLKERNNKNTLFKHSSEKKVYDLSNPEDKALFDMIYA